MRPPVLNDRRISSFVSMVPLVAMAGVAGPVVAGRTRTGVADDSALCGVADPHEVTARAARMIATVPRMIGSPTEAAFRLPLRNRARPGGRADRKVSR